MKKNRQKLIVVLLVAGIVLLAGFYFLNSLNSYKFTFEKEKVLFVSNEADPVQMMREFNLNDTVFISPESSESNAAPLFNAFNLAQVVFIGNDKNAVSLWRVVGKSGKIVSCRTNNGNVSSDIELNAADCQKILDDKNNAIILLSLPNGANSRIVFSQNRIEIVPAKIEDAPTVSFIFLKTMYANAELIIQKTNQLTSLVK